MDQRDNGPASRDPVAFAARLRALPPSCGPVRLVAVDGFAGSGKSTFAALLARELGGAPVVHLDDLATHDELFGWTGRLREEVLRHLGDGRPALHRVYDWQSRHFDGMQEIPPDPVVLIEGVGAGRRALRPCLASLLWLDVTRHTARLRGELRDGPELAGFWADWMCAQDAHIDADPSRPFADFLVRQVKGGYRILPGPARTG
jgi:uridine kinase